MEDLVRLYAALANNGELRLLRRASCDPIVARGRSIVMPEAAFLTLEMLNLPRPEIGRAYSDQAAPVFWKTGTSHGFHDAWSIAVFNHYVLAVWIGNFDGRVNGTFVGRIAAAPLLFQIIDSLRMSWPAEPAASPASGGKFETCLLLRRLGRFTWAALHSTGRGMVHSGFPRLNPAMCIRKCSSMP